MSDIRVEPLNRLNALHLEKVKTLGIKNTKTLGLFPPAAFDDYAHRGRVLVAVAPTGDCVGYVLFSTTNDRATIFHLCVDNGYRNKGLGRLLVEELATRTKHLRGLMLKCRRDYDANKIWPRLGFHALNLVPGRSKAGFLLVTWWRSSGGLDLFSDTRKQLAEVKLPVVIDANIIFDFQGRKTGTNATSLALRADWLRDAIELWVTPEASNEATRRDDAGEATKSLRFVQRFPCIECDQGKFNQACNELRPHFGEIKNDRDESDFRQVAWAIATGSRYFVTRDGLLRDRADGIADLFKVQIFQPVELIVQFDELRRAEAYQPVSLAATELVIARLQAGHDEEMVKAFQNPRAGESKGAFLKKLNSCLASPDQCDVFVVSEKGLPLVVYAIRNDQNNSDTVKVPLFRSAANMVGTALARHIAKQLVQDTIARGRRVTIVTDEMISDGVTLSMPDQGFFDLNEGWVKLTLPMVSPAAEVADTIKILAQTSVSAEAAGIRDWAGRIVADASFEDEAALWPVKISDLDLPAYVIPIESRLAAELFDVGLAGQNLFGRDTSIGINTEAVYYRSCHGCTLQAPARMLWYISESKNDLGTKAIRACSCLLEVLAGGPKELFRKFRRLGVYQWEDVYAAAGHDANQSIMAMRFARTELLTRPIPFNELRDELKAVGANPTMVGPVRIPHALFLKLYQKAIR